jgi:HK97 family phage major capsid protein
MSEEAKVKTEQEVIDEITAKVTPEVEKKFEETIQKALVELQKQAVKEPEKKDAIHEEVSFWKKALSEQSSFIAKAAGDIDTTANAATIVPTAIYNKIYEKLYQTNYVRQFGTVFPTGGMIKGTLPVEATGFSASFVAEGTAPSDTVLQYSAFSWSLSIAKASTTINNRLFRTSPVALLDYIYSSLANQFSNLELTEFITGSANWTGLNNATISNSVTSTATAISGLTYDNFIDTYMSMPQQYRGQGVWIMNGSTLAVIRKLKDSNNYPIFMPTDNTIFGRGGHGEFISSNIINSAMSRVKTTSGIGTIRQEITQNHGARNDSDLVESIFNDPLE